MRFGFYLFGCGGRRKPIPQALWDKMPILCFANLRYLTGRRGRRPLHGFRIFLRKPKKAFPWGNSPWRGKCHEVTKGGRLRLEERGRQRLPYIFTFSVSVSLPLGGRGTACGGRGKPIPKFLWDKMPILRYANFRYLTGRRGSRCGSVVRWL